MVIMAEGYLQILEKNAIHEALHTQPKVEPKSFKRYVDDSHSRFENISQAERFKDILNNQDPRIQYTMEIETEEKYLQFIDVKIIT